MKKYAAALLLPFLVASCAPIQAGKSALAPIIVSNALGKVDVARGDTTFVEIKHPASLVGIPSNEFDTVAVDFNNRIGGGVQSPMVRADWLKITPVDAPEGIKVSASQVYLMKDIRTTRDSGNSTEINYSNVVRVLYRIEVAATAKPGLAFVEMAVTGKEVDDSLTFMVTVK